MLTPSDDKILEVAAKVYMACPGAMTARPEWLVKHSAEFISDLAKAIKENLSKDQKS